MTYAITTLTIVGVEPPDFEGMERGRTRECTVALSMIDQLNGRNGKWRQDWGSNFIVTMARLKPGVPLTRADAEVKTLVAVAKDAMYEGLRKGVLRTMYIPWVEQGNMDSSNRSQPMGYSYLARVAGGDPMRLAPLMERAIPEIDSAMRSAHRRLLMIM